MLNNITKKDDDILSMKNSIKNDDIPLWMQNSESNNRQIDSRNKIEDEQPIKPNINEKGGFTIAWPSKQQKISENTENDILTEL